MATKGTPCGWCPNRSFVYPAQSEMRLSTVTGILSAFLTLNAKNYFGGGKEEREVVIDFKDQKDRDLKLSALRRLADVGITGEALDRLLADGSDALLQYAEELTVISDYQIKDKSVNDGTADFFGKDDDPKVKETTQLILSEEEALGMAHMCRINTFAPSCLDTEQKQMFALWLRNWYSLGLRPKILRRSDGNVFMMEFLPPSYGSDLQWFETDAFVRWMTLFAHGGGVMSDADVFGLSYDMPIIDSKYCYDLPPNARTHKDHLGGLVFGSRVAINRYIQTLIHIGHEETEARRATGQKLLVTDKLLAKRHFDRLFDFQFQFPGLMAFTPAKVLEESRALGNTLKRAEWTNEMLRLNSLNRNRVEIIVPQDTVLRAHPVRAMLDYVKCPSVESVHGGWHPTLPTAEDDIEAILPVTDVECYVGMHFEGSFFTDLKPITKPVYSSKKRPSRESTSIQKRKLILILEDPIISAWNRIGAKRPMTKSNPITRFFFGDDSPHLNAQKFDYQLFNQQVAELFGKLERDDGLTVVLLDAEHTGVSGKNTRLVLEYTLGYAFPELTKDQANAKTPSTKMDRNWRSHFEDENQADSIFYVIAAAHYERRVKQAMFLEKQLIASTTEIENRIVKLEL